MPFDLTRLLPSKFFEGEDTDILTTFLEVTGDLVDGWNLDIVNLLELLDPYNCPEDYIQHLADVIGFVLTSSDDVTISTRRKQLLNAIDWYRIKGTYTSIDVIALMFSLSFSFFDMYTNDYTTFVDQPWFVGNEGENPSDLDSTYYKSPHFGMAVDLDRIYPAGIYDTTYWDRHLWRPDLFTGITSFVERTRPANTVPHYRILLEGQASESLQPYQISATEVTTRIVGIWTYSKLYFDGWVDGSPSGQIYFDESDLFDGDISGFIAGITNWKLGTGIGSGYLDLDGSGPYALTELSVSGTIDIKRIYDDRVTFEFIVPLAVEENDINQIGLYTSLDELMIAMTFPDINKPSDIELKVIVTILRESV
jgi:hypothetical protein